MHYQGERGASGLDGRPGLDGKPGAPGPPGQRVFQFVSFFTKLEDSQSLCVADALHLFLFVL